MSRDRIPSLDGMRAVAILIVLIAHMVSFEGTPSFLRAFAHEGSTGVDVFFVLSGYLITGILCRERQLLGAVDLRAFYLRRARRIFPASYIFLLVVFGLVMAKVHYVRDAELLASALYVRNFYSSADDHVLTSHLWSLAVEEHFYLLWPLGVAWLAPRLQFRVALFTVIASLAIRVVLLFSLQSPGRPIDYWTPCRIDTILFGCMLALLEAGQGPSRLLRFLRSPRVAAAALVVLGCSLATGYPNLASLLPDRLFHLTSPYRRTLGHTVNAACIAVLLQWCVANPSGMIGRALNSAPMAWIGRISYSLYLWHVLCFANSVEVTIASGPWLAFPVSIALAAGSYYLIEKPFLAIPVRSRSHGPKHPPTPSHVPLPERNPPLA